MAVPHQLLPIVAGIDAISAALFSFQLAYGSLSNHARALLTRTGQATPTAVRHVAGTSANKVAAAAASATAQRGSGLGAWMQKVMGQAGVSSFIEPYHSITVHIAQSGPDTKTPKQLLLFLFMTCLARCAVVLMVSNKIAKGIQSRRSGGQLYDWSDTAVFTSIVCVTSILVDLFTLNSIFQSRGITQKGHTDTSISGILGKLDSSSFAAEQLLASFVEWILFVAIMGTNRSLAGSSSSSRHAARSQETSEQERVVPVRGYVLEDPGPVSKDTSTDSKQAESGPAEAASGANDSLQSKPKEYGAIGRSHPSSNALDTVGSEGKSDTHASSANGKPAAGPLDSTAASHGDVKAAPSNEQNGSSSGLNGTSGGATNDASADQSTIGDGALDPHRSSLAAEGSTAGDSSDIVDMPRDRKSSMQMARDRLQRARDSGRVRRRSLWKKIRGKGDDGASIAGTEYE